MMKSLRIPAIPRLFASRRPSAAVRPIADRVREARLTYLSKAKLMAIDEALQDIACRDVPGAFLECGVALGGSAIVISTSMPAGREFHGYDVFRMIPPPTSEHDDEKSKQRYEVIRSGRSEGIGGDPYYGYMDDLYSRVVDTFTRFGQPVDGRRITLHKGLFEDTLHLTQDVAFAHIDCDWYDPVKLCLQRIVSRLSRGGYVVLDDYNDYGGCRTATDEFLADARDLTVVARAPNFVLRRDL